MIGSFVNRCTKFRFPNICHCTFLSLGLGSETKNEKCWQFHSVLTLLTHFRPTNFSPELLGGALYENTRTIFRWHFFTCTGALEQNTLTTFRIFCNIFLFTHKISWYTLSGVHDQKLFAHGCERVTLLWTIMSIFWMHIC